MTLASRLLRTAPLPHAALEVAADRVTAANLSTRGGQAVVTSHAIEPLPAGALVPSLTGKNVLDAAAVRGAVDRALERIGRPRQVGLVLPDPIAKVSVLHFDEPPAREEDLDRLIRFQVRKAAPFAVDEAQIAWSAGASNGGRDFLVAIARRVVVQEYEGIPAAAGAWAGLVDLATFNVVNAVLAGRVPAGDWLLVHATSAYVSIAILRGAHLVFFRSRSADADDTIAEMVHQTAMYYEDRLAGRGFGRVLLSGATRAGSDRVRQSLEGRLSLPVEALDIRPVVSLADRIEGPPALLDALGPVAGLLLRGKVAA